MEITTLAAMAVFVLAFGLISRRIQSSLITGPMLFVLFGLIAGPYGLNLIQLDPDIEVVHIEFGLVMAEITLVLVLFTDASRIDLSLLKHEGYKIPVRLLVVGLPLVILLGWGVGLGLLGGLSVWEVALVAAILAPTDAALGQAVVSNPQVPARIRQALNVESGLNDGIALPVVLLFLSLAGLVEGSQPVSYWLRFGLMQIVLGPLVGVAVGYGGGSLIAWAVGRRWMSDPFQHLAALGVSVLAYALAGLVDGNGFIAAFCAGLVLGNTRPEICESLHEFGETEGQLLILLTFMVYGAVMVPLAWAILSWSVLVYALLSLTVVRMLPMALSLMGLGVRRETLLFVGWFGPRGIASIVFGLLVLEETELAGGQAVFAVVVFTVLLSIFAHGLSAVPGAKWYAAVSAGGEPAQAIEMGHVPEMPLRVQNH